MKLPTLCLRAAFVIGLGACAGPAEDEAAPVVEREPQTTASADARAPAARPPSARYVGVVIARESAELSTEASGKLVDIERGLGEAVAAGEVLARIEVPTLAAELAAARAALRSAQASEHEATLLVDDAERRLASERRLAQAGASADEELARIELERDKAEARARQSSAVSAEQRAQVERLEAVRASTRLVAPFSGQVSGWMREANELVEPGTAIVRIVATDELWVRFAVPIEALDAFAVGTAVEVELGSTARRYGATVRRVAPELEMASQMMLIEAQLDARHLEVCAGQACHVRLD